MCSYLKKISSDKCQSNVYTKENFLDIVMYYTVLYSVYFYK